jgi:hypothetical protein
MTWQPIYPIGNFYYIGHPDHSGNARRPDLNREQAERVLRNLVDDERCAGSALTKVDVVLNQATARRWAFITTKEHFLVEILCSHKPGAHSPPAFTGEPA